MKQHALQLIQTNYTHQTPKIQIQNIVGESNTKLTWFFQCKELWELKAKIHVELTIKHENLIKPIHVHE